MNDSELTLFEHLNELRSRLMKAFIALALGTALSVLVAPRAIQMLTLPLGSYRPQTLGPTEGMIVYFQVSLIGGLILAMPVIIYQLVRFMLPGLLPEERKYLYFLLPGATVCFAAGVAFAAFIMLPVAINFMQGFLEGIIENRWSLEAYISFVTRVLFWMGVIFQAPLLMFFLTKLGLITPQKLAKFRKFAILINAIIAAVVTPTPDPVNMMIVVLPLLLLYEVGIILARIAMVGRPAEELEMEGSA